MKTTVAIIDRAFRQYRPTLAYSGGGDSTVLLDIVTKLGHRPPLIYTDTQMEYDSQLSHIKEVAARYDLPLHVAKAPITPLECWQRYGYPMLGKMAAAMWMRKHPELEYGFRLNVSACCRKMKIKPGRDTVKEIGCNA
jgi:3'-phosphoadenosine 5'-phosphosulfate sulfotransferase (PAPS reductase)/FAD synthetase